MKRTRLAAAISIAAFVAASLVAAAALTGCATTSNAPAAAMLAPVAVAKRRDVALAE